MLSEMLRDFLDEAEATGTRIDATAAVVDFMRAVAVRMPYFSPRKKRRGAKWKRWAEARRMEGR